MGILLVKAKFLWPEHYLPSFGRDFVSGHYDVAS